MIKVYIESAADASKRQELLRVLSRLNDVTLVPRAADAEAILLTDDDSTLIRRAPAYRDFRSKFIVISDSDIMSYYIPALYTSNFRCLLSRGRALTISYYCCVFEDENGKRNIWIDKLKNVNYEKRFLYSFMGGSTCWLRKRLLKQYRECPLNDVLIKPTDHYKHWSPPRLSLAAASNSAPMLKQCSRRNSPSARMAQAPRAFVYLKPWSLDARLSCWRTTGSP